MTETAELARKMWRTLEPIHAMIYFVPEAQEEYDSAGLKGRRMGYFASRSAPMGAVTAEVVIATFFNFEPGLVRKAMVDAWSRATPAAVIEARLRAADRALRRVLGDGVHSDDVAEAAQLARLAANACRPEGRPLAAAHAALPWPEQPHLALWHAISVLREFRGDGHVAAMTVEGVTGVEALIIHGATGDVAKEVLQTTRAWPDDAWTAACERLRERGWLDADGGLTDAGRQHRQWVEDRTDALAAAPWQHLGAERSDRLRALVRPFSRMVAEQVFGGPLPAVGDDDES